MYHIDATQQKETIRILEDLISLPSDSSKKEEGAVCRYVASFFEELGYQVQRQDCGDGRFNVKALVSGKDHSQKMMYCGHLDTVPGGLLKPEIKDGYLYGRGSCDMKGSVACAMMAAKYFSDNKIVPKRDVVFLFDIDEEVANLGLKKYIGSCNEKVDFVIVGEPTDLCLDVGHRGVIAYTVTVSGKSSHASKPQLGDNSIYKAMDVISQIRKLDGNLAQNKHPLLGSPCMNVTQIHGGDRVNVIPDRTVLRIDRRLISGEDLESCNRQLADAVGEVCSDFDLKVTTYCPPAELDTENKYLKELVCILDGYGMDSVCKCFPATCEAGLLESELGFPSVVLGPGSIDQAHKPNEFVEISQLFRAVELYISFFE